MREPAWAWAEDRKYRYRPKTPATIAAEMSSPTRRIREQVLDAAPIIVTNVMTVKDFAECRVVCEYNNLVNIMPLEETKLGLKVECWEGSAAYVVKCPAANLLEHTEIF